MTDIQDQHDQLEIRLARAEAILRLMANTSCADVDTLQNAALDAADHVHEARDLYQLLAAAQKSELAFAHQPDDLSCVTLGFFQRSQAAL